MRLTLPFLVVLSVGAPALAQSPVYGAATPQDVVAGLQKASKTNDFAAMMPFISPDGRKELVASTLQPMLVGIRFMDPDSPMPGTPPPPRQELEKKRKNYKTAIDLLAKAFKPYGLDSIIGLPPMNPKAQQTLDAALARMDTVAFMTSFFATMKTVAPLLELPEDGGPKVPSLGPVSGYKITGDKATAKEGKDNIDFVRLDGRWYMTPPK
jgi:hypothetical protein